VADDSIERFAEYLVLSKHAVAFTGAGISTESGIPDFRSPGGLWSQIKPIYFQDFVSDPALRREAWRRTFSGETKWVGAQPNAGHFAVATLARAGKIAAVVTQNVDNLHQSSGVPLAQIIELHGNASYAKCLACELRHELEDFRQAFVELGELPQCRKCGSIVKTATISFGQRMPAAEMERAEQATLRCDLFIVLGSSLVVYPAAGLPLMAKDHGARLIIVNRDATDFDREADLVIHDSIGNVMSAVADLVSAGRQGP
jgi:NAD-dependent deacetylase